MAFLLLSPNSSSITVSCGLMFQFDVPVLHITVFDGQIVVIFSIVFQCLVTTFSCELIQCDSPVVLVTTVLFGTTFHVFI